MIAQKNLSASVRWRRLTAPSGKNAIFTIEVEGEPEGIIPAGRIYDICLCAVEEPSEVLLDSGLAELSREYDTGKRQFRLRFRSNGQRSMALRIALETGRAAGRDGKSRIYEILQRAQIAYDVKSSIYQEILQEQDTHRLFGKLFRMNIGTNLAGAIVEQIVSDC